MRITKSPREALFWRHACLPVAPVTALTACLLCVAAGADFVERGQPPGQGAWSVFQNLALLFFAWYRHTPPFERMSWGGLILCAVAGASIASGRILRLRAQQIFPRGLADRLVDGIRKGRLDRHRAADLCELNPSAVSRVALAAIRRWGRPTTEIERAVTLASRLESDQLRLGLKTLRRLAAVVPLVGVLGSLRALGRVMTAAAANLAAFSGGQALTGVLGPVSAGVTLAILILVAYDGLAVRTERLTRALERLGAELIDAIDTATTTAESRSTSRPASSTIRPPHRPRSTSPGTPAWPDEPERELA